MTDADPSVHRDYKLGLQQHGADVKAFQGRLNEIAKQFSLSYHLAEDGALGKATCAATAHAAFIMGLPHGTIDDAKSGKLISQITQTHLRQPDTRSADEKKEATVRRHDRYLRENRDPGSDPGGDYFTTFDGKPCPKWIAAEAQKVRDAGRWQGYATSCYRTPEYSESLCYGMCGAPSCPGTCAGKTSNHCCPPTYTGKPYEGAIDVTDYVTFKAECARLGLRLRNDLPNDPVHFSATGH